MDGFKKRLKESLQLRLSVSLALVILGAALVAGIVSFGLAFDEAHELQDDVLRQIAALIERSPPSRAELAAERGSNPTNEETRVIVQYLDPADIRTHGDIDRGAPMPIDVSLPDGMHTLQLGDESFRVMIVTLGNRQRLAIAQETGMRDEIARDSALRTLTPFLVLAPVLILLLVQLVRKMFRPIKVLSADLDARADQELHALEAQHVPVEIRPFVTAINRLLGRVGQSMATQRRFVADAAHELRSPLTAMSLQAERLAEAPMSTVAHERLSALRLGIERGRNLLEQLLSLARVQATQAGRPGKQVSILGVYRRVLEDLLPLAETKQIDIGVEGEHDAMLEVSEVELFTMIKNLVDNAIRYTPAGGRVDLSIELDRDCVQLAVADSGPGIAPEERERVFDPFYRVLGTEQTGSGLGLSIVHTIAERLGARIELHYADTAQRRGLRVLIRMPVAARSAG